MVRGWEGREKEIEKEEDQGRSECRAITSSSSSFLRRVLSLTLPLSQCTHFHGADSVQDDFGLCFSIRLLVSLLISSQILHKTPLSLCPIALFFLKRITSSFLLPPLPPLISTITHRTVRSLAFRLTQTQAPHEVMYIKG